MALINPTTGEYLKIYDVHIELKNENHNYQYIIFANEDQRQRYDNGLSDYETYKRGMYNSSVNIENELNELADDVLSIKDNIITAGYTVMKSDEIFSNWIDG
jgi:hypothetical protein